MGSNPGNLMHTAIQEMKNGQHTDTSRYFDFIVINNASNIEAPFFRAYCNCYDIKLGEMANAATAFTNAFCRYVDAARALDNPVEEQKKLDRAVILLSELVSMYQLNSKRHMLTTPSIGLEISTAANNMNTTCRNKLTTAGAKVSEEVLKANSDREKSNSKTMGGLVI